MRRAQSVRNYVRPSIALAADDLGVLREGDESNEDILRRQLLEKDRECDKLQMAIQALQDQLAQRPPIEKIQELEKEYKNLDLILQGTLRENEKSMADMERWVIICLSAVPAYLRGQQNESTRKNARARTNPPSRGQLAGKPRGASTFCRSTALWYEHDPRPFQHAG